VQSCQLPTKSVSTIQHLTRQRDITVSSRSPTIAGSRRMSYITLSCRTSVRLCHQRRVRILQELRFSVHVSSHCEVRNRAPSRRLLDLSGYGFVTCRALVAGSHGLSILRLLSTIRLHRSVPKRVASSSGSFKTLFSLPAQVMRLPIRARIG